MAKYDKENYLVPSDDVEFWKYHPNYHIIQDASKKGYLKGRCADVGCNIGILSAYLADLPEVTFIWGLDINPTAIVHAEKVAMRRGFHNRSKFVCSNFLTSDMRDSVESYDSVISFHTLEHIYPDDADAFVHKMGTLLKPGGFLVLSIPYDHACPDPCHVAFYKEDTIRALFERNNFDTVYCIRDKRWVEEDDILTAVFQKKEMAMQYL